MSPTDSERFSRDSETTAAGSIGHDLRAAREAAGLSIARLARLTAFSESHLRNAENGNRVVTIDIAEAYDRALDTGGVIVNLFVAYADDDLGVEWGATPAEVARGVSGVWRSDMRRRRVGQADVDAVWSMCAAFHDADNQLGGGHARATLICYGDAVVAPLLAGSYTDQVGRRLFAAAARLCDVGGFMCFDSGCQGLAQRYYINALRMAKISGDLASGASILTNMSMQAQHQGARPDAISLADAAVAAARRSGSALTLARCHAVRARALALRSDASGSDHALNEAERALDRAMPGAEPSWITYFTDRQLAAESMYAAANLGRSDLVRQHAARAPDVTDGMHRRHVLTTAALASSYLPGEDAAPDAGSDVGRACDVMRGVLPVLGSLTSARALDAVGAVRRRLAACRLPVVRELEQDLDRCMAGTRS